MTDKLLAQSERRRTFHTLDAMRGVAALTVVMHHYPLLLTPLHVTGAYLAVDLFFLMSGVVLAHAYDRRFGAGMTARHFMAARLCRLYPLFAIGTLIAVAGIAAALAAGVPLRWTWATLALATGTSALFLPTPPLPARPLYLFPLNIPAWSLVFELLVNAVFALSHRALRGGRLAALIGAGAVGIGALAAITGKVDGGYTYPSAWMGAVRVTFSFFLGVAMCRADRAGRWPRPRLPAWAVIVAATVLLVLPVPAALRAMYDAACVLVLFPLLVWSAMQTEPRRGIAACTALGLISYPIYVIHVPAQLMVFGALTRLLGRDPAQFAPWIGMAVLALLIGAAWLLARHVDPPLRRALERWLLHRPRTPPLQPPEIARGEVR